MRWMAALLGFVLLCGRAEAAPCPAEALETAMTGRNECIVLRTFKGPAAQARPQSLLVVVHGDVSGGGPANYHFSVAQRLVALPELSSSVAVALVRPGYEDGAGNASSGSNFDRSDSYTAANIDEIAGVVGKLKAAYGPQRIVLLGHSGGAAISAVLIGRHPGLVDGAVLIACPCHLDDWRNARNRRLWTRSESPHRHASRVPPSTRVIALTGSADDNTFPSLARDYVRRLVDNGVVARFEQIEGTSHNSAFSSERVGAAVSELVSR